MLMTGDRAASGRASGMAPFLRPPVRFDILSRRVPALDLGEAEESAAVEAIVRRLADLNAYVGDFRAGLKLLDHADANAEFAWSWAPIACRDAGVALINFRDALKAIGDALKGSVSHKHARAALRPIEQRFAAAFPIARAGRNGIDRGAGEAAAPLPRSHEDMCDAAITARVARAGRRVTHAHQGRAVRFELSEHSLWRLVALRNDAFAVFERTPN